MNCSQARKLFIFFIEKELPAAEQNIVSEHITSCNSCQELYSKMQATLELIPVQKQTNPNPFLYSRIEATLAAVEESSPENAPIIIRILKPALISIAVAGSVFIGFLLGNNFYQETDSVSSEGSSIQEIAGQYHMGNSNVDIIETYYLTEK